MKAALVLLLVSAAFACDDFPFSLEATLYFGDSVGGLAISGDTIYAVSHGSLYTYNDATGASGSISIRTELPYPRNTVLTSPSIKPCIWQQPNPCQPQI